MGRVYSIAEIEQGKVSTVGSHEAAARQILDAKRETSLESGQLGLVDFPIIGVMVHGSTARLEATVRSDVDVLTVFESHTSIEELRTYAIELSCIALRNNVLIEPIIVTADDAASGAHTIDVLFLEYLRSAEEAHTAFVRKLSGIELLTGMIKPYETNPVTALNRYVIAKRDKFAKASSEESLEVDTKFLQRALELPRALQRRFMQAYGFDILNDDTEALQPLRTLKQADVDYTNVLNKVLLDGNITDYKDDLEDISGESRFEVGLAVFAAHSVAKTLARR